MMRLMAFITALILTLTVCSGCRSRKAPDEMVEIHVFAAGSLTAALTEAASLFESSRTGIKLVFTFDSSGTLRTQIQEGAVCDVFISAASDPMDQLDLTKGGVDFVLTETRADLLRNKIVLTVPDGNPAGIRSFAELVSPAVARIAVGNADVPAGQYAEEVLRFLDISETVKNRVTYGSNVRELIAWTRAGSVDCSIVFGTDATTAGLEVIETAPDEWLVTPIVYPVAVLKKSRHIDAAREFLEFLQSGPGMDIFIQYGFSKAD